MGRKVVYWCANCKHIVPDYLRVKTICDYCRGDTVKIIEETKDMSSKEIIEEFIASGEKERKYERNDLKEAKKFYDKIYKTLEVKDYPVLINKDKTTVILTRI